MGMDLIAINKKSSFSFNWFGYRSFYKLLSDLKCNTDEIKFVNDGGKISKSSCRTWAKAILDASTQKKIKHLHVEDKSYHGGGYNQLVIVDNYKDTTMLTEISEDDHQWLQNVCEFLNVCNGCRQY